MSPGFEIVVVLATAVAVFAVGYLLASIAVNAFIAIGCAVVGKD